MFEVLVRTLKICAEPYNKLLIYNSGEAHLARRLPLRRLQRTQVQLFPSGTKTKTKIQ